MITIEPAKRYEALTIAMMHYSHMDYEAFKKYRHINPRAFKRNRDMVLGQRGVCFVAKDDETVVGYLLGETWRQPLTSVRYAELDTVKVMPEYRRRGIGTKLCQAFIEWAKESKFDRLRVDTGSGNESTHLFYEKLGFIPQTLTYEKQLKEL